MEEKNKGISLGDLIRVFWKNIVLVAIITFAITILGGIYTYGVAKEKYTSTATVSCAVKSTSSSGQDNVDYVNTLRVIKTIAQLVKTDQNLGIAAEALGAADEAEVKVMIPSLKAMISTTSSTDSYVFTISATGTDPVYTQRVAQEAAEAIVQITSSKDGIKDYNAKCVIVNDAKKGSYTSPNKPVYLIVSFLGGLVVACVVVCIREFASTKFKTREEIEALTNELIVGIQYDQKEKKGEKTKNVTLIKPSIRNFEPYNKLASNIRYSNLDNPYKVIMSTSTVMNELKSTTSANLAFCLAHNGRKTVIIDLDTRKPVLHRTFGVAKEVGIIDYIEGNAKAADIIKKSESGVDIVTVGKNIINPIAILESAKLKELVEELKKKYDYVIVDTPPLLACSDGLIISKLCDGVVYNIAMNSTKKNDVMEAITSLKNVDAKIIGLNITKAITDKKDSYYYYYTNTYGVEENKETTEVAK